MIKNKIKTSITFLFDEILQKFFHIQIQCDSIYPIYLVGYDNEILTLMTSSGLVLGPKKSSPATNLFI